MLIAIEEWRGRRHREGNDERVDDLNGQGNDQGLGANGSVEGVNGNVEGVNEGIEGAPDFSMIIAQQLQNLLPAMLAQPCTPNEYDGKGGVVVLSRWIEKMESVQDISGFLALKTTKTTQAIEITSLKRRVKKQERRIKSRTHSLKRLYKGRIANIDADAGITFDSTHFDADTYMFGVHDLDGDEVIVNNEDVVIIVEETRSVVEEVTAVTIPVSAATTTTTTTAITDVEMTLAQALAELKSEKHKANKFVIQ
ncbi:hypothetical protein Tco_1385742 [Tanacetum coccineum]